MYIIAYIDPGLGGLLVQSIIAGFLTVVYFFRNTIGKFFSIFRRKNSSDREENR